MNYVLSFLLLWLVIPAPAQNRSSVSGAEVTGTFRKKNGDEFRLFAVGGNRLKVQFDGSYVYRTTAAGPMANVGSASGTAIIRADSAVFVPYEGDNCTLMLKFLPGSKLSVDQRGDGTCGFGHNVSAVGLYKKINKRKPEFEQDN